MELSIKLICMVLLQLSYWRTIVETEIISSEESLEIPENEIKVMECNTAVELYNEQPWGSLDCTVRLHYVTNSGPLQCSNQTGIGYRSATLVVETSPAVTEIYFVCSSTHPIYADVVFEFGVPQKLLSKMKWQRVAQNYSDVSSYVYQLIISPPSHTHNSIAVTSVRYNIFNDGYEDSFNHIEVLWHFSHGSLPATVRWLGEIPLAVVGQNNLLTEMEFKENIPRHIPCVSPNLYDLKFGNDMDIWYENGSSILPGAYYTPRGFFPPYPIYRGLFSKCGFYQQEQPITQLSMSTRQTTNIPIIKTNKQQSDPSTRFRKTRNPSFAKNNKAVITNTFRFKWNLDDFRQTSRITKSSNSTQRADQFLQTPFIHSPNVDMENPFETHIVDFKNTQFDLECTSPLYNVTIVSLDYGPLNVTYATLDNWWPNNTVTKHITARCSTPVMAGLHGFSCDHIENDGPIQSLHWWSIDWKEMGTDDRIKLTENEGDMRCSTVLISDQDLDIPEITAIECENLVVCRVMAKCLQSPNYGTETVNCKQSGIITGTPCDTEKQSHSDPDSLSRCNAIKPFNKGLVQCKVSDMIFQEIYFIDFNGKLNLGDHNVIGSDPSSILKLHSDKIADNDTNEFWTIPGNYSFRCEAHSFYFEDGIHWFLEFSDGSVIGISEDISEINTESADYDSSNPSTHVDIYFEDISIVKVICSAPMLSIKDSTAAHKWGNASANVYLKYRMPPSFPEDGDNDELIEYEFEIGKANQELLCQAQGYPKPFIQWSKDNEPINWNIKEDVVYKENGEISVFNYLMFPEFDETNAGNYSCLAINEAGSRTIIIEVAAVAIPDEKNDPENSEDSSVFALVPVVIAGASTSVVVFAICVVFVRRKRMQDVKLLQIKEIKYIIEGVPLSSPTVNNNYVQQNQQINIDPLHLPYDKNVELQKDSFTIDDTKSLGKGEFGEVFQGRLLSLENYVAFKTVKSKNSIINLKSLASELKILIYIGKHENIIQLLGAYTQEIENGILYVAIEFCGLGSLEFYLRSNKGRFMQCPILNCSNLRNTTGYVATNRTLRVPFHNSIRCLLKWCTEIANAMDYLNFKKVVHSDLAARNVLITADFIAKITDFGLSRRTYTTTEYRKRGQDPLPWRWLAIESLRNLVFTSKSDVWSYGIVLWEIFSLGEVPYPGIDLTNDFVYKLESGLRNSKPKFANRQLYYVMLKCWNSNPDKRPSFASLKMLFENALICDKHTIDIKELECHSMQLAPQLNSYHSGYICRNEDGNDVL